MREKARISIVPRVIFVFVGPRVTLGLDKGVDGPFQKLLTEAAVQLGNRVRWGRGKRRDRRNEGTRDTHQ